MLTLRYCETSLREKQEDGSLPFANPSVAFLQDLAGVRNLEVGFELEALLLTGQCIDIAAKTREQVCTGGFGLSLDKLAHGNASKIPRRGDQCTAAPYTNVGVWIDRLLCKV